MEGIIPAWGRILRGYRPALSVEITRECPLRCPGCYAYGDDHLGGEVTLRQVSDFKGQELVDRFFALIDAHQPLHVSIVGGEPLVRYRELGEILPRLSRMGLYTQVVTSAVRPIPSEWSGLPRLKIVVSIDGLQPEHDERRTPATYDRILKHIKGHQITVHCTVTRQMTERPGYLREFLAFWSAQKETQKVWVSLFTPQMGETSYEILPPDVRRRVVEELLTLREEFPKLAMPSASIGPSSCQRSSSSRIAPSVVSGAPIGMRARFMISSPLPSTTIAFVPPSSTPARRNSDPVISINPRGRGG